MLKYVYQYRPPLAHEHQLPPPAPRRSKLLSSAQLSRSPTSAAFLALTRSDASFTRSDASFSAGEANSAQGEAIAAPPWGMDVPKPLPRAGGAGQGGAG